MYVKRNPEAIFGSLHPGHVSDGHTSQSTVVKLSATLHTTPHVIEFYYTGPLLGSVIIFLVTKLFHIPRHNKN
jgi:hypothetical protein